MKYHSSKSEHQSAEGYTGRRIREAADHTRDLISETTDQTRDRIRETKEYTQDKLQETKSYTEEQIRRTRDFAGRQLTSGIRKTRELKFYLLNFTFRAAIFTAVFILYLTHREVLINFMRRPFFLQFSPFHILWAIFMALMIVHLFPGNRVSMAIRKARENEYRPIPYDRLALLEKVQKMNISAWKVMLVWLSFNAVFGILYLANIITAGDLLMLTVFYFLCDYICILFYCPFQSIIMHNKCCINCRIYDWGHFMMFTPMLFIKNFFSWSLFFTSVVVLIHWEVQYARYPERFWEGSNQTLQCATCKEKLCQIKRKLNGTELAQAGDTRHEQDGSST